MHGAALTSRVAHVVEILFNQYGRSESGDSERSLKIDFIGLLTVTTALLNMLWLGLGTISSWVSLKQEKKNAIATANLQ